MAKEVYVCDERGRLLLPRGVREEYGKAFHLIRARDELVLIPISKDPLRELADLGKSAGIAHWPLSKLKRELRKQAEKELAL